MSNKPNQALEPTISAVTIRVLLHGSRQLRSWLIFNVGQKTMPAITTDEKTKGKGTIVKSVNAFLLSAGFTKIGTYEFQFPTSTGSGRLILNIPRFDAEFRMFTSFEGKEGRFEGPLTFPF